LLAQRLNKPMTIFRRSVTGEDEYGNEVSTPEEVETVGWIWKQQRADEEPGDEGEMSDSLWEAAFPFGTQLDTGDAVRDWRGMKFEVVGAPESLEQGSPSIWHVEAKLRRTAGAGEEEA